ncbi:uncharacterized protein [Physcomitrium patens]|uniref:uncharacterized protein isoform X2 n=1 Tax=Physcomitrium patens TaxID=3218 RepID=UPI003CCD7963
MRRVVTVANWRGMETARMLAVSSMGGIGFTSAEEGAGGDGLGDSSNNCLQLSRTNKLIAFSGFLGFGMLLQMMSMTMFLFPKKFAVMYTMGNLFTISRAFQTNESNVCTDKVVGMSHVLPQRCSCFLCCSQKMMQLNDYFLTILSIIVELCTFTWYALSYIPFARQMVKSCFQSCWGV